MKKEVEKVMNQVEFEVKLFDKDYFKQLFTEKEESLECVENWIIREREQAFGMVRALRLIGIIESTEWDKLHDEIYDMYQKAMDLAWVVYEDWK